MPDALSPAGELREAARRLRELAAPVPLDWQLVRSQIIAVGTDRMPGTDVIGECQVPARAAYVASMHPGVALAVADWLETEAGVYEAYEYSHSLGYPTSAQTAAALKTARAYLGSKETDRD